MRYGMPYQGSKNSIATWVVEQLPKNKEDIAMTKTEQTTSIKDRINELEVCIERAEIDGDNKNLVAYKSLWTYYCNLLDKLEEKYRKGELTWEKRSTSLQMKAK